MNDEYADDDDECMFDDNDYDDNDANDDDDANDDNDDTIKIRRASCPGDVSSCHHVIVPYPFAPSVLVLCSL